MQVSTKINFNFMIIGTGFLFFFNSNTNISDILPDFIGYILLGVGIGHLYLINDFYAKARSLSFCLCIITFLKFIISFYTKNFNSSDTLLITTCFNLIELFISFNLVNSIFKANELFLELNDNFSYAYKTVFYSAIIKAFLLLKYLLGILAESVILISPDFIDRLYFNRNIYIDIESMRKTAVLIFFIVVTLFSVFVLSLIIPYFHMLWRSKSLTEKINILILRVEDIHRIILFEKLHIVFLLLYSAVFLMFELKFDGINVLPDFVAVILLLIVYLTIKRIYDKIVSNTIIAVTSAALILSLSAYILHIVDVLTYTDRILSYKYSINLLFLSNIFSVFSNILFIAIFISLYFVLEKIRLENMNYTENVLNIYIPKKEKEKNVNRTYVYIYVFAVFLAKSILLFVPDNALILLICTMVSTGIVIYSIYKLNEIKRRINYYYASVKKTA